MAGLGIEGTIKDDSLVGSIGHDVISGLGGHDTLIGSFGADQVYGGAGNDLLQGGQGNDLLEGGAGDDRLEGGVGSDTLRGEAGDDALSARGGLLDGGAGTDTLDVQGLQGPVSLYGGLGDDLIQLSASGEAGLSGASAAVIEAGEGRDTVWANLMATGFRIDLGAGNDALQLVAHNATGTVDLGAGNNVLDIDSAFGGNPVIVTTGAGVDRLMFDSHEDSVAVTVTDFTTGAGGDVIDLLPLLNWLSGHTDEDPFSDGYLRLQQHGADTRLVLDADGVGGSAQLRVVATFQNTSAQGFSSANFHQGLTPIVTPNQVPVLATPLADVTRAEDTGQMTITLPAGAFVDPDGGSLSLFATLASGAALPGWLSFDAENGRFVGTPPAHFNGTLSIRVTASDGLASVWDQFDLRVTPVNDAPNGALTLSGTAREDQTLTVGWGALQDADGLGALRFQWLQGGSSIAGATSASYRLGQADVGSAISVRVSYVDGGEGNDLLDGGLGHDSLLGAGGANTLLGQAGNDRLDGGGGQ